MYVNFRTGYSFRHAVGKIPDVLDAATEHPPYSLFYNNYAPIADRGSCYGWGEWEKESIKRNLKPIFGVELAVCTEDDLFQQSKPGRDYWIFYSKNLSSLNEILRVATSQSKHIFKGGKNLRTPILSYNQALRIETKNIIKICSYRVNTDELMDLLDCMPAWKENLYAGFSVAMNYIQFFYLKSILELPFVITSENKYPYKHDLALYQNICGRGAITKLIPQHILSRSEFYAHKKVINIQGLSSFMSPAKRNALKIFDQCKDTKITTGGLPKSDSNWDLKIECYRKLKSKNLYNRTYHKRLTKELKLITDKNYTFYFKLVANICLWARKNMLVGPGRGSASGSLVCYLLNITSVDPIKYNLSFERFLTEFRTDLPDIDIDFPDRERVIHYLKEKFGKDNVAKLGTVNMYQARSALRESASAMGIPQYHVTKTIDSLIEYPAGSKEQKQALRETLKTTKAGKNLLTTFPEFAIAKKIENHPRHAGVHASGVIISNQKISDLGPLDCHGADNVLMFDKEVAEDNELLKIDILGLHQLAIIEECLKNINVNKESLPTEFNDELVFDVLRNQNYGGIFQFEGSALQSVCNKFYLKDFEDMAIVTSIARKGPLSSGAARNWLKKRNDDSINVSLNNAILDKILKSTSGVIVFQEQVMAICRDFAKMSWEEVMGIRKAIGKSKGREAIDKYSKIFKNNINDLQSSKENYEDITNEFINELWEDILQHGGYSFNRAHAICYSVISYWCMWLKAYSPQEFIAASLSFTKDEDKKRNMLIEATTKLNIEYKAVDEQLSLANKWRVHKDVLIGPFTNVFGIGDKLAKQIMGSRKRGEDIKKNLLDKIRNNKIPLANLHPIYQSALKLSDGKFANKGIRSKITNIDDIQVSDQDIKYTIICTVDTLQIRNVNEERLVKSRNGKIIPKTQPQEFLSGYLKDDTGKILVQINAYNYTNPYAKSFFSKARPNKTIFCVRGVVRGGEGKTYKKLEIENFKYLGEM